MTILMMRQYVVLAVLMALVWALWMIRNSVALKPHALSVPSWSQTTPAALHAIVRRHTRKAIKIAHPLVHPEAQGAPALPVNGLPLQSTARQYTYIFSGKIACGSAACQGIHVQANLQTSRYTMAEGLAVAGADGTYSVQVTLNEFPQEQVNWTLTATRGGADRTIQSGHQILTDDESTIHIDKPLVLS